MAVGGLDGGDDDAGQRQQRYDVRHDHELVEHIRQLPDEVVGKQRAEEDERDRDDGVDEIGLLAEEVAAVDAAEHVPADNGGEREEQQAYRDERAAEAAAHHRRERELCHVRLAYALGSAGGEHAVARVERGDDDEGGHGEDDEGVDKHARHGGDALLVRGLDVGLRVGVRGGAHTGFIGEQAAFYALTDGGFQRVADAAADERVGDKGIFEDHADGLGDVADACDEDDESADEVQCRHDGDDLLRHGRDALHAADKDERAHRRDYHSDDPVRHAESVVAGLGDGVGLHHRAHEAEGEDYRDREEACEELAAAPLEGGGYVVHGAAADRAVLMDDTRGLREDGFGVYRRHAEERDYPHPEYRAGAADEDRAGCADNVAGSDLRGDGGGERLERAHAAVMLLAEELDLAERLAHGRAEIAHLHEAGLYREEKSRGDEHDDEDVVREIAVDGLNDLE